MPWQLGMLWQEIEEPLLFLVLIVLFPVTIFWVLVFETKIVTDLIANTTFA